MTPQTINVATVKPASSKLPSFPTQYASIMEKEDFVIVYNTAGRAKESIFLLIEMPVMWLLKIKELN